MNLLILIFNYKFIIVKAGRTDIVFMAGRPGRQARQARQAGMKSGNSGTIWSTYIHTQTMKRNSHNSRRVLPAHFLPHSLTHSIIFYFPIWLNVRTCLRKTIFSSWELLYSTAIYPYYHLKLFYNSSTILIEVVISFSAS